MNIIYPENDYRSYLAHHGILGQRWGVRRFQNKDGSLTSKGKQRYGGKNKSEEEPNDATSHKGLTDRQKRAIMIGAGVLGVSLAAYGTYRIAKSGGFDTIVSKVKDAKAGDAGDILGKGLNDVSNKKTSSALQITEHARELSEKTGFPLKESFCSVYEDEKLSNPFYDPSKEEYHNNCGHACLAWCLRKMGLDVEATPMKFDEVGGLSFGEVKGYLQKVEGVDSTSIFSKLGDSIRGEKTMESYKTSLSKEILKQCNESNGAFGIIKYDRSNGTSHFFGFEIDEGTVRFPNPQNHAVSTDNYFAQMADGRARDLVEIVRVDNRQFRPKRIKEFAKPSSHK